MSEAVDSLCAQLFLPGSERLARIWSMLCDEDDARLLTAMPGTAAELAAATGLDEAEVERRAAELFHRGVVFRSPKPHGTVLRGPRHLIQLHDASVQWAEAPREFLDTWKELMAEEYPVWLQMVLATGFAPFMHVIPSAAVLADLPDLQEAEDVVRILEGADDLAVCNCPCRRSEQNCRAPVRTCLQLGKGARYAIERGNGERITREQALEIVRRAAEEGLVHTVEHRATTTVVCNCCSCCCAIIRPYNSGPELRPILAPSRFRAVVDAEACTLDEICVDSCPAHALAPDPEADTIRIDEELCLGCGLCVPQCPVDALSLEAVRPPEFLPS
jgi:NAD-dependent dihydropyrimidine dehydrogenase PreA subunit